MISIVGKYVSKQVSIVRVTSEISQTVPFVLYGKMQSCTHSTCLCTCPYHTHKNVLSEHFVTWQVEYKENSSVINTTILFRHNRLNAFGGFNNLMPVSETKIDIFVVIVWDGLTQIVYSCLYPRFACLCSFRASPRQPLNQGNTVFIQFQLTVPARTRHFINSSGLTYRCTVNVSYFSVCNERVKSLIIYRLMKEAAHLAQQILATLM